APRHLLTALVWLGTAGFATAQQPADVSPRNLEPLPREFAARVYEDVEIMRRLLDQKLEPYAPVGLGSALAYINSQQCQNCHDTPAARHFLDFTNPIGTGRGTVVADIDRDGYPDLYVANEGGQLRWNLNFHGDWLAARHAWAP